MIKINIEKELFSFDELSKEIKEKVINEYNNTMCYIWNDQFSEYCGDVLNEDYPNSKLNTQYSLSYCQGDGLNIYGTLHEKDFLSIIEKSNKLNNKELKTIKHYIVEFMDCVPLPENTRYCYCISNEIELDGLESDIEYSDYKNINYELLRKCEKILQEHFSNLCYELEKEGYDWLYPNTTDNDIIEDAEANNYMFERNGSIYWL